MILIGLLAIASAARAHAATLDQAFEAAIRRSETVADQQERLNQAEERYRQAVGGVLPSVTANASYLYQSATGGTISPQAQPNARITATQPLFRGLREYAALRQADRLTEAQREAKLVAGSRLYLEVAGNYSAILVLEEELRNLAVQIDVMEKRVKELKERAAIGRSRRSEVLAVEASHAALVAQADQTRGQLAAARETLAFLTGLPREERLEDFRGAPSDPGAIETYLERSGTRPDVRAAERNRDAAEEGVAIERGAHLPTADLAGNYYLKRSGLLERVKWDVQLQLSLPLFAGGAIASRVREAASRERQGELALSLARRGAEQEIRTLYEALRADLAQVSSLRKARELAERTYQEQSREYRLGLANNLEVLQSLAALNETRRSLDRAVASARLNRIRLEIAAGSLPETLRSRQ